MGFLAAIPAAIGGLFEGGAAAAGGAAAGTAAAAGGVGAGLTTSALGAGALGAGALTGAEAMTGAAVPAIAGVGAGAGAGAGGLTLGMGLKALSPFLGGLGKVASAGADMLGQFGDVPLSRIFGGETGGGVTPTPSVSPSPAGTGVPVPKADPLVGMRQAAQFGTTLKSLFGGAGGGTPAVQLPAMSLPQPPSPIMAAGSPTAPNIGYTPTAKTIGELMFRR